MKQFMHAVVRSTMTIVHKPGRIVYECQARGCDFVTDDLTLVAKHVADNQFKVEPHN